MEEDDHKYNAISSEASTFQAVYPLTPNSELRMLSFLHFFPNLITDRQRREQK